MLSLIIKPSMVTSAVANALQVDENIVLRQQQEKRGGTKSSGETSHPKHCAAHHQAGRLQLKVEYAVSRPNL